MVDNWKVQWKREYRVIRRDKKDRDNNQKMDHSINNPIKKSLNFSHVQTTPKASFSVVEFLFSTSLRVLAA